MKSILDWRKALSIASDIIPKIPQRKDGTLVSLIKVLGIVDSISKQYTKEHVLYEYFSSLGLEGGDNAQFVRLFFNTRFKESFVVTRIQIGEHSDVVKAYHESIGAIYFVEWHWGGKPTPSSEFWYTKGFKFDRALTSLWHQFNGRVHIGITHDRSGEIQAHYTEIPNPVDPVLGSTKDRLQEFIDQHKAYMADKVPRTYLFSGTQGVGKTSFALHLAELVGNKTLRVDACGITTIGAKDLDFVIDGLTPNFLIVDDIDRAPELEKSLPTLFATLSDFKGKHPDITVVLTCNDLKKLDPALIRPGRIDEILEFEDPNENDRREILVGYLKEFEVRKPIDLEPIVQSTKGLTAAYLREIALQLRYRSQEKILSVVQKMNELVNLRNTPPEEKTNPMGMPIDSNSHE